MNFKVRYIFFTVIALFLMSCEKNTYSNKSSPSSIEQLVTLSKAPVYRFKIIHTYPHDTRNFTEGLQLDDEFLYESSGGYQQSKLEKKELVTGKVLQELHLSANYFAEGLTIMGDSIYQLTYREHTAFQYDKNTFHLIKNFHFPTEGWGLTSDGKQLIMSDGTATLFFMDPNTFQISHTLVVHDQNIPIIHLNELEYINGNIYANVWPSDFIAIISPQTGQVAAWIDIHSLHAFNCKNVECVANGIAYQQKNKSLLVTGKYWSYLYEIQLIK